MTLLVLSKVIKDTDTVRIENYETEEVIYYGPAKQIPMPLYNRQVRVMYVAVNVITIEVKSRPTD